MFKLLLIYIFRMTRFVASDASRCSDTRSNIDTEVKPAEPLDNTSQDNPLLTQNIDIITQTIPFHQTIQDSCKNFGKRSKEKNELLLTNKSATAELSGIERNDMSHDQNSFFMNSTQQQKINHNITDVLHIESKNTPDIDNTKHSDDSLKFIIVKKYIKQLNNVVSYEGYTITTNLADSLNTKQYLKAFKNIDSLLIIPINDFIDEFCSKHEIDKCTVIMELMKRLKEVVENKNQNNSENQNTEAIWIRNTCGKEGLVFRFQDSEEGHNTNGTIDESKNTDNNPSKLKGKSDVVPECQQGVPNQSENPVVKN